MCRGRGGGGGEEGICCCSFFLGRKWKGVRGGFHLDIRVSEFIEHTPQGKHDKSNSETV